MNGSASETIENHVEREFDVPRDVLWTAYTQPQHAKHWSGPAHFTTPVYEIDLRPGGRLSVHMQAPDGTIFPTEGVVEAVEPPERLVVSGGVSIAGEPAFEATTAVTFVSLGTRSKLVVHQVYSKISAAGREAIAMAPLGWEQQNDKFAAYLATMRR